MTFAGRETVPRGKEGVWGQGEGAGGPRTAPRVESLCRHLEGTAQDRDAGRVSTRVTPSARGQPRPESVETSVWLAP